MKEILISIIICSRRSKIESSLEYNIKNTIGNVPYEIVWIYDEKKYSIFEAYNRGVGLSRGRYLCFMHDDIVYLSSEWGQRITVEFANNQNVGMLGLIGSCCLTPVSSFWWGTPNCQGRIYQGQNNNNEYTVEILNPTGPDYTDNSVVVVDGMWMVVKKELFSSIRFDTDTYTGFHWYDMDLCMQVLKCGYKIHIVSNIDVEHKSIGSINAEYWKNCICFHKKWDSNLPIYSHPLFNDKIKRYEHTAMMQYFTWIYQYFEEQQMMNSCFHRIATKLYNWTRRLI